MTDRQSNRYVCPFCLRKFPYWYWGVPNRAGSFGTVIMTGLARANFKRHKDACERKQKKEAR